MSFFRSFFKSDDEPLMESMDTMDSWRTRSTTLVDLRKKPRYDTLFSGEIIEENGSRTRVTISNISSSGLRVEGLQPDLDHLMPRVDQHRPHTPMALQVGFSLPGSNNQTCEILLRSKTVYMILGEYRDFKIGMQITAFDQGEEGFLEYISFRKYRRS